MSQSSSGLVFYIYAGTFYVLHYYLILTKNTHTLLNFGHISELTQVVGI